MIVESVVIGVASLAAGVEATSLPDHAPAQRAYEQAVIERVSPERLREMHETLAAEPHRAGTPGDQRVIQWLTNYFGELGLEVEVNEFDAYLAEPGTGLVRLVEPVQRTLPIREAELENDPWTRNPAHDDGWNAYSGSGDVTAPVVYVNYGTKDDFERLAELGVSLEGKIALARYGRNYRGYKAKFAEEAGAIGLIMYTDPGDSGYGRGAMWPEGGWANETSIQRGSILTLDYPGDPLTPGVEATPDAERLDPRSVALPGIPVQPVGWAAAEQILSRMTGREVPDESWRGGLPLEYRLTCDEVRVRLSVSQQRRLIRTANVIATLRGTVSPEQMVIIGSHHDAWGYGAADPLAGTIAMLEAARVLAEEAKQGARPARSIVFAAWGAEEYGIIGSTEWVEGRASDLAAGGVAYINLDVAAMGPHLRASAAPALQEVVAAAAAVVPSATDDSISALEEWRRRTETPAGERPPMGALGGGSDHVALYLHAGVPSVNLGASGAQGSAYHTMLDHIGWYQQVVGDDYTSAQLVARVTAAMAARLAGASLVPLDLTAHGTETLRHLDSLDRRARELGVEIDLAPVRSAAERYLEAAEASQTLVRQAVSRGALSSQTLKSVNGLLVVFERLWLAPEGLAGRPWYRHLFASSDPTSGYSAWMLPEIRGAIEEQDADAARAAVERAAAQLRLMTDAMRSLRAIAASAAGSEESGG